MYRRALVVWLVLIAAEIVHGVVRAVVLVPRLGPFRSNQIGVLTGSMIILVVATFFVRWIGTTDRSRLLMVGLLWLVLTLAFEMLFGRLVVKASWERLLADYNVLEGGLLPFGMMVLVLSPLIAAKIREWQEVRTGTQRFAPEDEERDSNGPRNHAGNSDG